MVKYRSIDLVVHILYQKTVGSVYKTITTEISVNLFEISESLGYVDTHLS